MDAKRKSQLMAVMLASLVAGTLCGQGTFQNLDFENGAFVPIQGNPYFVEPVPALPGWTAYVGTNVAQYVLHNTLSLTPIAGIAIWGPDQPQPGLFHGQYYVVLQVSFPTPTEFPSLAQTGTIPLDAQSIQFYTRRSVPTIAVAFSGEAIPLSLLGGGAGSPYLWGGDVSSYAGQTGELRFLGDGYLDFIQFSTEAVPEPSVLGLFALGALLFGWRWRQNLKS